MEHTQSGFTAEKRADNDNRKLSTGQPEAKGKQTQPKQESFGNRWRQAQPTKTMLFWSCLAAVILTMLVGFNWGGWVTGGTAQKTATTLANDAVVQRLAAICVAQFQQDPAKDQKLVELKAASSYQRGTYVKEQGWATMPDGEQSDTKVAAACAKQLMLINP